MSPRSFLDRATLGSYAFFFRLPFAPGLRFNRLRHMPDLGPMCADVSLLWFCVWIHQRLAVSIGMLARNFIDESL